MKDLKEVKCAFCGSVNTTRREYTDQAPYGQAGDVFEIPVLVDGCIDCGQQWLSGEFEADRAAALMHAIFTRLKEYDKALEDAVETIELFDVDPDYHHAKAELERLRRMKGKKGDEAIAALTPVEDEEVKKVTYHLNTVYPPCKAAKQAADLIERQKRMIRAYERLTDALQACIEKLELLMERAESYAEDVRHSTTDREEIGQHIVDILRQRINGESEI